MINSPSDSPALVQSERLVQAVRVPVRWSWADGRPQTGRDSAPSDAGDEPHLDESMP